MTLLAARAARVPLVDLGLLFPAGGDREPAAAGGVASLTASLLDEGTARADALAIAAAVADLGGRFASNADWDVGYLDLQLVSRHAAAGLDLLVELATGSVFPPEEVERQLRRRTTELLRRRADPGFLADRRFARTVYGEAPYGRSLLGDEESLARLDRDRVEAFFGACYAPAAGLLIAAGDLDPEAFAERAEERLGSLPPGRPPAPVTVTAPASEGVRVEIVDRPHGAQTELRLGHAGIARSHPDYLAATVMNAVLGGKFTSRINLNLRERNGYTYGASSRFDGRRGPGPFAVRTAVATGKAGAAAAEVLAELRRIRDEPVADDELEDARSYLIGTFPYTLQSATDLVGRLETLAVHELGDDYYDLLPERLRAIDAAAVQAAAQRHLHPDRLAIVAVGPADELAAQLAALGPVTVHPTAEPAADGG